MFNLFCANIAPFDFAAIFKNISSNWYYYVVAALFILAVVFVFFVKKKHKDNLTETQRLCYSAVLTAFATVANMLTIQISSAFQVSLIATIGFIAGYLLGGGYGFAVCFIGDLIGGIINPLGAYNPIIGIGSGLWGLIPGVIFSRTNINNYLKIVLSYIVCSIVISGFVNTLGIYLMYGLGKRDFIYYFSLYPIKLAASAVNLVISILLLRIFDRILPKSKFAFDNVDIDQPCADARQCAENCGCDKAHDKREKSSEQREQ